MRQEQVIVNNIKNKVDFTFPHKSQTKRYIVGKKLLHEGKNPSLFYGDIYEDVYKFLENFVNKQKYSNKTIGGWLNKDKGTYCVDIGKSFNNIEKAINFGLKHNQVCIYDTLEDKTINI